MQGILERVEQTIEEHRLIKSGDSILVALSGGPDSIALLHLLLELKPNYDLVIAAAHLDHSLRTNSANDRIFCKNVCAALGIKFYSKRLDVAALAGKKHISLEEAGRQARYDYFGKLASGYVFTKIATGHTRDDNVETIIFNMVRGSGLRGLAGIPASRSNIIRPLIDIGKADLVSHLKSGKIKFVTDHTNLSSKFARNRIRMNILPQMEKLNPAVRANIARMAKIVGDELRYIEKDIQREYGQIELRSSKNKIVLDLRKLRRYDKSLRQKMVEEGLRRLKKTDVILSSNTLSRALGIIDGKSGTKTLLEEEFYLENSEGKISIFRVIKYRDKVRLNIPGTTEIPSNGIRLETRIVERRAVKDLRGGRNIAFLDNSKAGRGIIRFWNNGDKFAPFGMTGHRLLSDIFIDRKIPEFERRDIPLVVFNNKIAWIAGLMISDEFKVEPDTRQVLEIKLCAP